ncbi:putative Rho guanine nucleotide exchange factor 5 [Glarea lozoyensis 74030]|uniref:Putative Rho guanine nucleotide exchange factor 5 n=1 Tax=Glarea lozoyensis (strain ATCC 74030 / MF5533) TaxID=1104152 RepID=H0ESA0_GLAL7|nr:putative Rho guanine nucleotide exchange factor 5 [Glarea lozoyensis 74030]
MAYNPVAATNTTPEGYEVLPGGRIARMSALEAQAESPPRETRAGTALSGASGGAAYAAGRSRRHESSSDDSALGFDDPQSPHSGSGGDMSSPQGVASQQSEQLPFFKDYYSSDEIHPGDKVATLWAYQPRAGDEFALERGDMLKVVGIWDDGWATGVLINENAEDWEVKKQAQRDSGVSHTSGSSPNASGEIKAFPLVCVCLPDHWRKTIEGDGSTETTSTGPHGGNT